MGRCSKISDSNGVNDYLYVGNTESSQQVIREI